MTMRGLALPMLGFALLCAPASAAGTERVIRVRPPMDLHRALDEAASLRARDPGRPVCTGSPATPASVPSMAAERARPW
jgi:hypothetical protein